MFVERSPISGTSSCTSPYDHNQQREKVMSYEAASCHNSKNSPRTIPIQSPTISNSERTVYRGSRKIEKGERERKRVADIRKNVDMLRERIQDGKHPEFMKGSSKKPTRLQTLKTAICYICSLSKELQGDRWECRCVQMGMEHRQITGRPGRQVLPPPNRASRTTLHSYENPHHTHHVTSHVTSLNRGFPPSLSYGHFK
ncbi:achaete-scute complex protein T8-like isoform X2 [Bolinopsis microptera]|uniref:achaete-scute complex protein T8-like isoform X2 n=1 Tax=Bolinopsis microptera TaxID=2820187 RepID=UPI00307A75A1